MPDIGRIQSTNFQSLLTELGITRNQIPFSLRSEVTPVVLVGGTVSFLAPPEPAYRVQDIFTTGVNIAPAAASVLADTGPLPIGGYTVKLVIFADELNNFSFEWRNAGNTANLQTFRAGLSLENPNILWQARFSILNDNERFRVINIIAGAALSVYQCTIFASV